MCKEGESLALQKQLLETSQMTICVTHIFVRICILLRLKTISEVSVLHKLQSSLFSAMYFKNLYQLIRNREEKYKSCVDVDI